MRNSEREAVVRFEPDDLPEFSRASRRTKRRLRLLMTTLPLSAGRTLLTEDGGADQVFVVVEGSAEVIKDGEVVDVLGCGAVVGEIGMLLDSDPSATVNVVEDSVIAVAYRDEFEAIVRRDDHLRRVITRSAADRILDNLATY